MKLSNLYRSYHAGIFWQRPVKSKSVSDPNTLSPSEGDRYIVGPNPVNAWEDHENDYAEWDGSQWLFTTPIHSHASLVDDENTVYIYSYDDWVSIGRTWTTDEEIQDAVGSILDDGTKERIIFTYDDADDIISADFNEFDVNHDLLNNYNADEHIDWLEDQGSTNINEANITSLAVTQHEEDIDHNALTNYDPDQHINHSDVNITTTGILSGSGDITSDINIDLQHSDVDHNQTTNYIVEEHRQWENSITQNIHDDNITSSSITQHEADIDHNNLTNTHQAVYTTSSPSFSGVTITGTIANSDDAVTKEYVDNKVQGLEWQSSVIDFYDPSGGLPSNPNTGDRYISTATANGWTEDYIYEWDGSSWIEFATQEGWATWVEVEDKQYVYDGSNWIKLASIYQHNNLSGVQGGITDERYHLQYSAYNNLSSQDQTVETTSSVTFDDVSISTPSNIYNLDHDSFSGFVSNEHIDHSTVTVSGGSGLSGGGDLTTDRTISLDSHDNTFHSVSYITDITNEPIGDLSNVNLGTLQDGETLIYDPNANEWVNGYPSGTDYVSYDIRYNSTENSLDFVYTG